MATAVVTPQSNGFSPADPVEQQEAWELAQNEKIIQIRDQVFAGTHPRLKLLAPLPSVKHSQPSSTPRNVGNDSHDSPSNLGRGLHPPSLSNLQSRTSPNPAPVASSASGIDPIFLTKSDVLVRAETQQRRQRIERVLADQVKERQASSKQRSFDHEDLPGFDVTEALRKAQELVKPVKFSEISGANGNASASDSFDENTFYSSQMNDSTPEAVDKSDQPVAASAKQDCKFFLRGENCPYGDQCTYAHDASKRRSTRGPIAQVQNVNQNEADSQTLSDVIRDHQQQHSLNQTASISQAERIAQLEAQLMALQGKQSGPNNNTFRPPVLDTRIAQEAQEEESIYSPPDAFPPKSTDVSSTRQRDRVFQCRRCSEKFPSNSKLHHHVAALHTRLNGDNTPETPISMRTRQQQRRIPAHGEAPDREYPGRENRVRSPIFNEGRIVRNQITSPVAPQPARVSPLAVSRIPPIPQHERLVNEDDSPFENGTRSEKGQPSNPKKRRRVPEPGEKVRNVIPRREPPSPEIRIKEEPMSPAPLTEPIDRWEARGRQDRGPVYLDEVSPRYHDQERIIHRPGIIDRPSARYVLDGYPPAPASVHEPDLRRIVSTRQARAPVVGSERYSSPQLPQRAASHVYIPRQEAEPPRQYRQSIQPEVMPYMDRDVAASPRPHEVPTMMAPPPRRIVVDQYGNRFYEQEIMPMPRPRQQSLAAYARPTEYSDQSFQAPASRPSIVRIPQAIEDGRESNYIPNGPPSPPGRYIEYLSPAHHRQPVERGPELFYGSNAPIRRDEGVRMIEYPHHTSGRYEEMRPAEGIARMSSVRPVSHQYEGGPERVSRVQSVHPEGRRVVSLGSEMVPSGTRHMSVRPDDAYARTIEYAPTRSQYYPGHDSRA
ncbi:MAG: hypothetical protein LQ350_003185 [Teloschistes chrysophthalmus]|nr:MAG: hypothetical protein LQ350_003185 [Niorma chrysophthalma]